MILPNFSRIANGANFQIICVNCNAKNHILLVLQFLHMYSTMLESSIEYNQIHAHDIGMPVLRIYK